METIVVGVDGSRPSIEALRWAVEEAQLRGARLRVVHVWHLPLLPGGETAGVDPDYVRLRRHEADRVLTRVLAHVRLVSEGLTIETATAEGHPGKILVDESLAAALLVVGSRGRGGFARLLLGSVGHQCAQHARCPVAIVRAPPEE